MWKWKIFYWDGSTFDYRQGAPADVPRRGVEIIVQVLPNGSVELIRYENFYYYVSGDRWYGSDEYSVLERLRERRWNPDDDVLTSGRLIKNEDFWAIYRAATNDFEYPDPVG